MAEYGRMGLLKWLWAPVIIVSISNKPWQHPLETTWAIPVWRRKCLFEHIWATEIWASEKNRFQQPCKKNAKVREKSCLWHKTAKFDWSTSAKACPYPSCWDIKIPTPAGTGWQLAQTDYGVPPQSSPDCSPPLGPKNFLSSQTQPNWSLDDHI